MKMPPILFSAGLAALLPMVGHPAFAARLSATFVARDRDTGANQRLAHDLTRPPPPAALRTHA
jgi:hypothetical protein